jgi:hypothetical protein
LVEAEGRRAVIGRPRPPWQNVSHGILDPARSPNHRNRLHHRLRVCSRSRWSPTCITVITIQARAYIRILAGDLWLASDAKNTRSSSGYVRHYIIDISEAIGGGITSLAATSRLKRQHAILARYLTRLSPLSDVHAVGTDQLCAVDLARLSKAVPVDQFRYRVVEIGTGQRLELAATLAPDGLVCFRPKSLARRELADNASERRVIFEVRNGTAAGPLEIHTCDLGPRGMFVVGLNRRAQ